MNKSLVVVPLNLHCPVEEAVSIENNDNANESHLESRNDSTDECDSTDSDESETKKTDSCREKSMAETDSCTQSRKGLKSSTSSKNGTQKKWLVGRTSNRFYRILRFFGRQKRKIFPVEEIPEENEFEETKSTISKIKKDRSASRTRNETGIDSRYVWGNECERSTESARSSNYSTFQRSEGSLVSKKVICCSTCSSPMVIHEIILANPQKMSITPQNSRAGDETVSVEDVSEKSLPENQENSETYIMEKSESSGVISEGTENSTTQSRHSIDVETLKNKSETSEVCKDSNIIQNVINVFESLQITSNEGSEIVERDSTPDDDSTSEQEFHKPVDCEEPECETKIDESSGNMTYSDSEKVIAEIDYTEEFSLASMTTTTTTSTSQLDKSEENAIDTEESEQTIVENQFIISDQSMESHNAIRSRTFDRYSSFKKKYIPVRSNCDTSSSLKSGPDGVPTNSRTKTLERTEYLFYPKKFCDPLGTNKTHTVMWVSHHHPQENLRKIDEKNREIMEHLTNLKKTQDNHSMKYCAPRDILEMTLGKYKSNMVSAKDFQNKLNLLDTKYNQNKTDSIQNIYLNRAFHDHLKSNEYFRDEYDFPTDIKINGIVYRQFDREYIPIKLKSEYKWKLFARRTIYSRSRKSVHSSKYSRTFQRNKEKSRNSREIVSSRSRKRIVCDKKCKNRIKSPSNSSRVSLTESANDEEDCRTFNEQLSKISICLSDYSD